MRWNKGFTLVEIMAALAILGLTMFLLLQAHYGALKLFEGSKNQIEINELLKKAMAIAEVELANGNVTGSNDFGKRYPGYTYNFQAAPVSEETPYLYEILVTLQYPGGTKEIRQLAFYRGN